MKKLTFTALMTTVAMMATPALASTDEAQAYRAGYMIAAAEMGCFYPSGIASNADVAYGGSDGYVKGAAQAEFDAERYGDDAACEEADDHEIAYTTN